MAQLPELTLGIPTDSPHYGHLISYNERCILAKRIVRIERTDTFTIVRPDPSDPGEVQAISESFLYCETCGLQIASDEIDAEDWEVG